MCMCVCVCACACMWCECVCVCMCMYVTCVCVHMCMSVFTCTCMYALASIVYTVHVHVPLDKQKEGLGNSMGLKNVPLGCGTLPIDPLPFRCNGGQKYRTEILHRSMHDFVLSCLKST